MKKRKRTQLTMITIVVLVIIILVVAGILVVKAMTGLESLTLSQDFAAEELDINTDYTFTITADPETASLKSLEYVIDNSIATFTASDTDDGKAVLHTVSEGTVTVCVKKSGIESNYLTFNIVDQAAAAEAQAQAEAEAEAAAQAEAEAAAQAEAAADTTELVMVTGDNVNVRQTPSTDGEVLVKCNTGDSFTRYEETDDGWSRVDYNGEDAYISSDFLKVSTEEEIAAAKEEAEKEAAEKEAAAAEAAETADTTTDTTAADTAAAEAAAAVQAQADALAAAQAQAAALAAAQAAAGHSFTDKNGTTTVFTTEQWNYFLSYWDYTGQAEEMISHHTCAELQTLYNNTH